MSHTLHGLHIHTDTYLIGKTAKLMCMHYVTHSRLEPIMPAQFEHNRMTKGIKHNASIVGKRFCSMFTLHTATSVLEIFTIDSYVCDAFVKYVINAICFYHIFYNIIE